MHQRWRSSGSASTAPSPRIRERVGDAPLYLSIDIDVLDPAHAPGTGTPEAGGLTSRELLGILRGLAGIPVVGADVVEVAPAYDHAEMTTVAAAHVCYRAARADGAQRLTERRPVSAGAGRHRRARARVLGGVGYCAACARAARASASEIDLAPPCEVCPPSTGISAPLR